MNDTDKAGTMGDEEKKPKDGAGCAKGEEAKADPAKAEGGAVEGVLTSAVERLTSALNQAKAGKVDPSIFAMVGAVVEDLKALQGQYPSPKAAMAFTVKAFDAFVAKEAEAILAEPNPEVRKVRTIALGEAVAEFRKQEPTLANAGDNATVTVQVYQDPVRQPAPTTQQAQPQGGAPGEPAHALKGDAPVQPPAAADAPAQAAEKKDEAPVAKKDPTDDGKWPMDMNPIGSKPMVNVGKAERMPVPRSRVVGAIGDMTAEQD